MIAILGATGTIGLSLARLFARDSSRRLALFARNPSRLAGETWGTNVDLRDLDGFNASEFRLVVNAIGAGDPARVKALGTDILGVTGAWDQRVLDTMGADTRYVFISSGAVHGAEAASAPPYTLAKLQAEARHRQAAHRSNLDVRVFGYADVTLPLDGSFLLSDLARSVATKRPFVTTPQDMVRDYAGAEELVMLIQCWEKVGAPNTALDLYTRKPVSKSDLLKIAQDRYGIEIQTQLDAGESPTGTKLAYASSNRAAAAIGYGPRRAATDVVVDFLDATLRLRGSG